MLKNLFLAPGRFLLKIFSGDRRRTYRSARPRTSSGLGLGLLSAVLWVLMALAVLFAADKAGFLNKALDVGVEAAGGETLGGDPAEPAQEELPEEESGPGLPNATGRLDGGSPATTAPPPADPATSAPGGGQTAVEQQGAEMWLVILHSIPKSGRDEAERRQKQYKAKGLDVKILDTDAFPRLVPGNWIIALGPFDDRASAMAASNRAKEFQNGLMVRRGL